MKSIIAHARNRGNFFEEGDLTGDLQQAIDWFTKNSSEIVSKAYELNITAKYLLSSKNTEKKLNRIFEIIMDITSATSRLIFYSVERAESGGSVPPGIRNKLEEIIWYQGNNDPIDLEIKTLVNEIENELSKFIST